MTLVDAQPRPRANVLGEAGAQRIAALHAAAGVRLLTGLGVRRVSEEEGVHRVELADGVVLDADVVVAGLGSLPNVEWLEGSGLPLGDSVVCDEHGRTGAPGIYAAGDVAAWRDVASGRAARHEHWTAAREQGRIVAQVIAGTSDGAWRDFLPYFWSDIHGRRVQLLGATAGADGVAFAHDDADKGAFVAEFTRGGELIGVAGCNAAARVMRYAARLGRD